MRPASSVCAERFHDPVAGRERGAGDQFRAKENAVQHACKCRTVLLSPRSLPIVLQGIEKYEPYYRLITVIPQSQAAVPTMPAEVSVAAGYPMTARQDLFHIILTAEAPCTQRQPTKKQPLAGVTLRLCAQGDRRRGPAVQRPKSTIPEHLTGFLRLLY